jgi:hypothetical protein
VTPGGIPDTAERGLRFGGSRPAQRGQYGEPPNWSPIGGNSHNDSGVVRVLFVYAVASLPGNFALETTTMDGGVTLLAERTEVAQAVRPSVLSGNDSVYLQVGH